MEYGKGQTCGFSMFVSEWKIGGTSVKSTLVLIKSPFLNIMYLFGIVLTMNDGQDKLN